MNWDQRRMFEDCQNLVKEMGINEKMAVEVQEGERGYRVVSMGRQK